MSSQDEQRRRSVLAMLEALSQDPQPHSEEEAELKSMLNELRVQNQRWEAAKEIRRLEAEKAQLQEEAGRLEEETRQLQEQKLRLEEETRRAAETSRDGRLITLMAVVSSRFGEPPAALEALIREVSSRPLPVDLVSALWAAESIEEAERVLRRAQASVPTP